MNCFPWALSPWIRLWVSKRTDQNRTLWFLLLSCSRNVKKKSGKSCASFKSIYLHVPLAFCFPHFLSPSAASPSSSAPIFPSPRNTRDGSIKCIELHPWLICRAKKRSRGRCLFSAPLSPLGLLQPACLNSQRGRFIKTDQKNEGQHIATQIGWGVSDSQ